MAYQASASDIVLGSIIGEHQRLLERIPPPVSDPPVREVTHACPVGSALITPCCGKSPMMLPMTDRITLNPALVTCSMKET
jgi:hypothetical protein